jgi:uncharacterized pyridoxal phosphate-containing UPF0001 family protein
MTMGTIRTENFEQEARRCFKQLATHAAELGKMFSIKLETSMGMSQDYEIAVDEGTNWIRLGTMMFE